MYCYYAEKEEAESWIGCLWPSVKGALSAQQHKNKYKSKNSNTRPKIQEVSPIQKKQGNNKREEKKKPSPKILYCWKDKICAFLLEFWKCQKHGRRCLGFSGKRNEMKPQRIEHIFRIFGGLFRWTQSEFRYTHAHHICVRKAVFINLKNMLRLLIFKRSVSSMSSEIKCICSLFFSRNTLLLYGWKKKPWASVYDS